MLPKYRNPRDGFRPGPPFPRNRGRVGFARSYSKPHNPPASKLEILLEAGRLAAEYLVSKGVLPASSLPTNMPRDNFHASRVQDRENPASPVSTVARTSALARLGDHVSDARYGRKRLADDYDRVELRSSRGRQRSRFYNGPYSTTDWDRERGRNGPWRERIRDLSESIEGDVDNFAPGYHRDRYEEVGSSISRVAGNEQQSKGEAVGESGSETDDAGSKVSSNSTKKDLPPNMDVDENKGEDDLNVSNSESMEVKSSKLDDLEENNTIEKDLVLKLDGVLEGDSVSSDKDLLKLSCFPKVPKRPRTLLAHKVPAVVFCPSAECGNVMEFASGVESETARGKVVPTDGSLNDLHIDQVDNLKCVTPANTDTGDADTKSSEAVESLFSVERSQLSADTVTMMIDGKEKEESVNHVGEEKELQKSINSSLPNASLQNDFSQLDGSRQINTSFLTKLSSQDLEILDPVNQLKQNSSTLVQKVEDECLIMMEEEKQNQTTSFKICDLNLMEAPEITEIASDRILEDSNVPSPPLETEKQLSVDFGMSRNSKAKVNHDFNQLSSDEKVMMIDLVDDPLIEVNDSDSSKTKNEMIYSAENVLNNIDQSDDLPVIQENYNLAISDYLGSDIPCSPSVEAHLNNLQVGMGLHGAEGFSGVDDAIYGSLGDIGFMEVWDQPTQDYEKFF